MVIPEEIEEMIKECNLYVNKDTITAVHVISKCDYDPYTVNIYTINEWCCT